MRVDPDANSETFPGGPGTGAPQAQMKPEDQVKMFRCYLQQDNLNSEGFQDSYVKANVNILKNCLVIIRTKYHRASKGGEHRSGVNTEERHTAGSDRGWMEKDISPRRLILVIHKRVGGNSSGGQGGTPSTGNLF